MENEDFILEREAEFQDEKAEKNTRHGLGGVYNDLSSNEINKDFEELTGDINNKSILEIGCGLGDNTIKLLKKGAFVAAIDISPKSIEKLQKKAEENELLQRLDARVMDAQKLLYDDESFDMVIGLGILHHLPDQEAALREIARVLKKDSKGAFFIEPLDTHPAIRLYRSLTPKMRTKDEQPLRKEDLSLIKSIFPNAEFVYYDCFTLLAKPFAVLGLSDFSNRLQKKLLKIDNRLLRSDKSSNLFKHLSWRVIIKLN